MSGTLTYWVSDGKNNVRSLKLTVCSEDDRGNKGVIDLRRRRLWRLIAEASRQGIRLSYRDLSMITLSSKSTLKRDVSYMRRKGIELPRIEELSD